jgi:two-component system LytT family response regulator
MIRISLADVTGCWSHVVALRRRRLARPDPLGRGLEVKDVNAVLDSAGHVVLVPVAQLDRVTADNNQVRLQVGATTYRYRQRISVLERQLDPRQFLRVHRSTIVNVDRVREIRSGLDGDFLLLLDDGTRVVTSAAYGERLAELLKR